MKTLGLILAGALALAATVHAAPRGLLDTGSLPERLRDRGPGIPTSMFGVYVERGQLLVYPFFEHYRDADFEYAPDELGRSEARDFRGDYEASEQLLYIGYGISDRLAVELEGAVISAELETSADDRSGLPAELVESGVGDVEGQIRFRWAAETERRPEIFSYLEVVTPTQPRGSLIGTSDWEFKLGTGVVRGYRFGTLTVRAAVDYERATGTADLGEVAVEYLRRLSPRWRIYAGLEGGQDEIAAIGEAQWLVARRMMLKLNSGFGLTSKATDWAPEVGVLFAF